jgi:hypothetical protein
MHGEEFPHRIADEIVAIGFIDRLVVQREQILRRRGNRRLGNEVAVAQRQLGEELCRPGFVSAAASPNTLSAGLSPTTASTTLSMLRKAADRIFLKPSTRSVVAANIIRFLRKDSPSGALKVGPLTKLRASPFVHRETSVRINRDALQAASSVRSGVRLC